MDLSKEDEEFIVSVDNGNWEEPAWKHYCIGASCICKGQATGIQVERGGALFGKNLSGQAAT